MLRPVKTTWHFDGCFIFVGYDPNNDVYPEGLNVDERGYIITDEYMATNIPGVYAIGDVRKKVVRQVSTAVGDGGVVMTDIERYFREGSALRMRPRRKQGAQIFVVILVVLLCIGLLLPSFMSVASFF